MAGTLTVDQLKASTGVLATQNGMTGIAKAWVNFNGNSSVVRNSFNVSSITYNSLGINQINFTTPMPNANYVCCSGAASSQGNNGFYISAAYTKDANACWVWTGWGTTNTNVDYVTVAVFGN